MDSLLADIRDQFEVVIGDVTDRSRLIEVLLSEKVDRLVHMVLGARSGEDGDVTCGEDVIWRGRGCAPAVAGALGCWLSG